MADHGIRPEESDWGWVRQVDGLKIGGCLTFARGVSPERVIEAFGMDPAGAAVLSEAAAQERFPPGDPPRIRVGSVGDWAFAVEELTLMGSLENVARDLSAGTESVAVDWTAKPTSTVRYFTDGIAMTVFEADAPNDRAGREPDRFLAEMRQAGMRTEPRELPPPLSREEYLARRRDLAELRRNYRDPVIVSLGMLTLALGIRLPAEVARGPLLTVSRGGTSGLS
jgi:Family of unknown function (DUF6461)